MFLLNGATLWSKMSSSFASSKFFVGVCIIRLSSSFQSLAMAVIWFAIVIDTSPLLSKLIVSVKSAIGANTNARSLILPCGTSNQNFFSYDDKDEEDEEGKGGGSYLTIGSFSLNKMSKSITRGPLSVLYTSLPISRSMSFIFPRHSKTDHSLGCLNTHAEFRNFGWFSIKVSTGFVSYTLASFLISNPRSWRRRKATWKC
mmetsp:Transcript_7310/g.24241  ORF Transcript_7310/g.24241 Transcript_7310/m.24241 type:complete len:201 (+) Transcript_7310:3235-3837(+)